MLTIRVVSIIAISILLMTNNVFGQSSDTTTQQVSVNNVADEQRGQIVDTSALRMFFKEGDEERVEKEIARLQQLHPEWAPPKNLNDLAEPFDQFSKKFWLLFSAEKYQECSVMLAEYQASNMRSGSIDEMKIALERVKSRQRLLNALAVEQHKKVIQIADNDPSLISCKDPEVLWGVAASLAKTGYKEKAKLAYVYMFDECQEYMDYKNVFWKATEHLDLSELIALQESLPSDRADGLQNIIMEIYRREIIGWTEKWNPDMGKPEDGLKAQAERLVEHYNQDPAVEDALLLGWFYRTDSEREIMHKWFERAYQLSPSFEAAEAVSLSFMENSHYDEAESFMYEWLMIGTIDKATEVYLSIAANFVSHLDVELSGELSAENVVKVDRISVVAIDEKDATLAQGLGWLAFKLENIRLAEKWFRSSLIWDPEMEPAAYGLALIYLHYNKASDLQAIQAQWPDSHRIQLVGTGLHVLDLLPTMRSAESWFDKYIVQAPVHYKVGEYVDIFVAAEEAAQLAGGVGMAQSRYGRNLNFRLITKADLEESPEVVTAKEHTAAAVAQTAAPKAAAPAAATVSHRPAPNNAQSSGRSVAQARPVVANASSRASNQSHSDRNCRRSSDVSRMSAAQALQHGWCLMEINRDMQALMAFERALQSTSASIRKDAAYGHSLALMRKGLPQQAISSAQKASLSGAQRKEIEIAALTEQALQAWANGQYQQVIYLLQQRSRISPVRSDLLMLEAWSYAKTGRAGQARRIFRQLAQTGNAEARRALADLES